MHVWIRWYQLLALVVLIVLGFYGAFYCSELAIRVDLTIPDRTFPNSGVVIGKVCDIFGDPVPGVSVTLATKHTVSGEDGGFSFPRIPIGNQSITLEAEGYEKMDRMVKIDADSNNLEFKYGSGLFPQSFSLDFHIYYTETSLEQGRCFGEIGLANGSNQNYYLLGLVVYNPLGVENLNLLETEDDYREIAGTLSDTNYINKPRMAVFYQPREYLTINLPPLANPIPNGLYTLKCVYASQTQWDSGLATMEVLETQCVLDDDWNPHT